MNPALLVILAIAPVITIILLIYFNDRYEKEPIGLLIGTFFLGTLTVVPVILLSPLGGILGYGISDDLIRTFIYAIIFVGFFEEGSKFLVLRFFAYRRKAFNEPFDGIVYSVMVSMGFATVENIMYVLDSGVETALLRAITAVPAHAAFAVIMGFYVGAAKFTFKKKKRVGLMWAGLSMAVLFHGLYDYFLFTGIYPIIFLSFVVLAIGIILSIRAIRIRQRLSPYRDQMKDFRPLRKKTDQDAD